MHLPISSVSSTATSCHGPAIIVVVSHAGTVVPECFKDDNASQ